MINSVNSSKSLLAGNSESVKLVHYKQKIQSNTSKIYPNLPQNLPELDVLVERKTPILNKRLKMNLTKKKKNLVRDIVCDFLYDSEDGYQEVKGIWKKEYDRIINALVAAKSMPRNVYLVVDYGSNIYLLNESKDDSFSLELNRNTWANRDTRDFLSDIEEEIAPVDKKNLDIFSCNLSLMD